MSEDYPDAIVTTFDPQETQIGPPRPGSENDRRLREHATFQSGVSQVMSGFNDVVAEYVGIGGDAAKATAEALGIDFNDEFAITTANIKKFFQYYGITGPQAENGVERVLRAAGRTAGEALPLVAGGSVAAGRIAATGARIHQGGRGATQALNVALLDPFRRAPVATPTLEMVMNAVAGAGGAAAREGAVSLTQDPTTLGAIETAGDLATGLLAGGVVAAKDLAGKGTRALKLLATGFSEADQKVIARGIVADRLQQATPNITRSTGRIDEVTGQRFTAEDQIGLSEKFQGFRPTTAQIINEPGVLGIEQELARKFPDIADHITQSRTSSNRALLDAMENIAPANLGNEAVGRELQRRVDHAVEALDDRINTIQAKIEETTARGGSKEEASAIARQHLEAAEKEFRMQAANLFDAVDPTSSAAFPMRPLVVARQQMLANRPLSEAPGDTPTEILESIKALATVKKGKKSAIDPNVEIPYTELRAMRSRISQAIRDEERALSPNRNRIRKLITLKGAVDETLDSVADSTKFPDVAARYTVARQYFAKGAGIFREGSVRRGLRRGPSATPESATLPLFFNARAGAKEAAEQYIAAVGNRPDALDAVREYAISDVFARTTDKHGIIVPDRLRRWLQNHAAALQQFPELKKELGGVLRAQQRIEVLGLRQKRVNTVVQDNAAALYIGRDPLAAMRRALSSANPAEEAQKIAKLVRRDPGAQEGVRRSFWDVLTERIQSEGDVIGSPFLNPRAMISFINKNEKAMLAIGYQPKDIATLKDIIHAADIAQRSRAPATLNAESGEPRSPFAVLGLNQLLSRLYGIQRGVVSGSFVAGELGSRFLRQAIENMTSRQVNQVWKEVLVNPPFARDLLRLQTLKSPEGIKKVSRRVHSYLITAGIIQGRRINIQSQDRIEPEPGPTAPFFDLQPRTTGARSTPSFPNP